MVTSIVFTPRAERDAHANMASFIELCKTRLRPFGNHFDFDANEWDVTEYASRRGMGTQRTRVHFSTLETANSTDRTFMESPFLDFAKAYLCYTSSLKSSIVPSHQVLLTRIVEAALKEHSPSPDPTKITVETLNRSAQIAMAGYSHNAAYTIGNLAERLGLFLNDHGLTEIPFQWKSPVPRPETKQRVGKEFDEQRKKRLPSPAALEALPQIFRMATESSDIIVSSVAALLCAAPSRVCELFELPSQCEVDQTYGPDKKKAYCLRWWPAKGADPMLKVILPEFADVVREAVAKIRTETESARKIARWYEQHPNQMYLPVGSEHLRHQEWLTNREIELVMSVKQVRNWRRFTAKVENKQDGKMRFEDVERNVLAMLPANFPVFSKHTGLKYSEALFVVLKDQMNIARVPKPCMIEPITMNTVNYGLGARIKHCGTSIFSRFGFTEPDGSPIQVVSNQFRHYLNTVAQYGGMSQLDIAKWSGRTNIHQNSVYDHLTTGQMLQIIQDAVGNESQMFGPLAKLPKKLPVSRDEFARLRAPTVHVTDIGFCIHDFVMSPCQRFRNCISCEDLVCVKGDPQKTHSLRERLGDIRGLLIEAEKAREVGYAGSERWIEHYREVAERYEQLHAFLTDPAIPDGTVIQLAPAKRNTALTSDVNRLSDTIPERSGQNRRERRTS